MMPWLLVIILLGQSPIEAYMGSADACHAAESALLADLQSSDSTQVLSHHCLLVNAAALPHIRTETPYHETR